MRRSVRLGGTCLVVVLLAGLIAAPQVAAAPSGPTPPAAGVANGPFRESDQQIQRRGHIVASDLKPLDASARATRTMPRLPWRTDSETPAGAGAAPRAPLAIAAAPPEATVDLTHPSIVTPPFNGLAYGGPFTELEPPDPWVAVGPNHIVQAVNVGMRITNRQGGNPTEFSLASFFELPVGSFHADPRVIYDSTHGRWIVIEFSGDCFSEPGVALNGHGYIDVAISDTADPRGGWTLYYVQYNDRIPDFPGIGTSLDKIALSGNIYTISDTCDFTAFQGTGLHVLDWGQMKAGNPGMASFWTSPAYSTLRPALGAPSTSNDINVVLGVENGLTTDVGYFNITGTVPGGTVSTSDIEDLTTQGVLDALGNPPQPRQPGTPPTIADAVDGRITDAISNRGYLYFVSTTGCTPNGDSVERACVRVSQLAPSGGPGLMQDFLLAEVGYDLYMGGIGVSQNGALHVTYTRSSSAAGAYPSTYAVYQLPTDPPNTVSPAELVKAGTGSYQGVRWGDYAGVAQDPQDPNVVWQTNEVSRPGTDANGYWSTHISSLSTAVGGTYFPITPHRVLDTRDGTGGYTTKFFVNQARTITVGGTGPIPMDAVAVTANVTVARQTGAGHFAIGPLINSQPTSSIINFPVGDVRANNATLPLGESGYVHAWYVAPAGSRSDLIIDVTGYFKANDTGATYNAVTPDRVLDTRFGVGQSGKYVRDIPESFQVSGTAEVPLGAVAVTGNLTVTGHTASGHVSLTPNPAVNPSTSTVNFPLGDTRANGLTIPLSATGKISAVYKSSVANSTTHLIFDVTGYYLPDLTGLRFYALNPGRRMDTRTTVLTGLTGKFNANTSRVLDTAGHMGVPPSALAITGNLTVTQPNKAGHLAITPSVIVNPPTSTINFPASDTRANGVTQPLNGSGDMAIYFKAAAGGTVHAILDITGYFR